MKWIIGSEKQWNCEHVNKCWVLLDQNGQITEYCTDYPEPNGYYRYIFAKDIFPEYPSRPYIPCNCQPERSKREDSNCFMNCQRAMCDPWDKCICGDHINCNIEMRCSEHCGNTVRDK